MKQGFDLLNTLRGIKEGTFNILLMKKDVENVAQFRLSKCAECKYNSEFQKKNEGKKFTRIDNHCTICGCNLTLKTHALAQECPLGSESYPDFITEIKQWHKVASPEEAFIIEETIEKNEKAEKN